MAAESTKLQDQSQAANFLRPDTTATQPTENRATAAPKTVERAIQPDLTLGVILPAATSPPPHPVTPWSDPEKAPADEATTPPREEAAPEPVVTPRPTPKTEPPPQSRTPPEPEQKSEAVTGVEAETITEEEAVTEEGTETEEEVGTEDETAKTGRRSIATVANGVDSSRLDRGLERRQCGIPTTPAPISFKPAPAGTMIIDADDVEFLQADKTAIFSGHVEVRDDRQLLAADKVDYNKAAATMDAQDNVYYEKAGIRLTSPAAHVDLASGRIDTRDVEYRLTDRNGRGHAETAVIESDTLSHYTNIDYSTCPPGQDDWVLRADKLNIDRSTGKGVARNARLSFKGVPFLYTPYASFPIDDRRLTGFLSPSFGRSENLGTVISIPYYLNIAPQADATITPRIMTRRGLMLEGEARYLGERHKQTFLGQIVPDDRDARGDENTTRGGISWQASGNPARHLSFDTNINYVSDKNYLDDFAQNLIWTSTKNLERRADLSYNGNGWNLLGRLQHYQTVDESVSNDDKPYSRLPQLLLRLEKPNQMLGLTYHLRSEYSYFKQPSDNMVEGNRVDLQPGISLPLRRPWGFFTPKASVRYTAYRLGDEGPGVSDTPDRTIPTFSLDSGLVFERSGSWLGNTAQQTLEPRLFYLYVPKQNQDDLPDFDTSTVDFSMANLFRENRFSGADRVGDANQLTTVLTTRTLSPETGAELFRGSIGQIFYFRDREVQLNPTDKVQDDNSSAWVAEAAARLTDNLSTRGSVRYNTYRDKTEKGAASLHYLDKQRRILNLSYRYDESEFETADISGRWPLTPRLHTVGYWNYSLKYSETMAFYGGLEYETCCWIGRFIARQLLTDPDGEKERVNSVMLQVELKGLTSIGSKIDEFLEQGILGYQTN